MQIVSNSRRQLIAIVASLVSHLHHRLASLFYYLVFVSRIQAEQYGKSRGIMMCICMLVVAIFVLTGILVLKWM